MKRLLLLCTLFVCLGTVCASAYGKVFFRISSPALPPAQKTGIQDLVLVWPLKDLSIATQLRSQGYNVWLQCVPKNLAAAVAATKSKAITGLIVEYSVDSSQSPDSAPQPSYVPGKELAQRVLIPGGKQPQMKSRLVVERDGVLQVSSPSTQPWLDTNLATVRIFQATSANSIPITYDFHWDASEVPLGSWHPDAEDYALAIAEADAIRCDVIIDLPTSLQRALNSEEPDAWRLWKRVTPYLKFSAHVPPATVQQVSSLGVIVDGAKSAYEPVNLMARHNLAFEAVRASNLTPARLNNWNSVVVFGALKAESVALLREFAENGGVVVFVNSHKNFPWHATPPFAQESHSMTYKIGPGEIVELGEPVIDPENFARDLRRVIGRERLALGLWNSLTTLVTAYYEQDQHKTTLYFVNYANQPDNVQVQVKGHFSRVGLESPLDQYCITLPFVERNGFTEFTIPSLQIAARVHLDSGTQNSAAH